MCILNLFSVDGWPGWYSVNNISWVENFSFFYISASPNIHGKLLYINHHRPKGQLIETMALIHEGKFITRLMGEPFGTCNWTLPYQFFAFEFPASAFFLLKRQRRTFWEDSETIFNCQSRRRHFSRNLGYYKWWHVYVYMNLENNASE